jgi:hypothetical protein
MDKNGGQKKKCFKVIGRRKVGRPTLRWVEDAENDLGEL